jgi:molecular chaperone GrpE
MSEGSGPTGGDTPDQETADAAPGGAGDSGVIPVEVSPPDSGAGAAPAVDRVAELEQQLAAAEKEKKDNWDRYLRTAADLENQRKRGKRELDDARFETKAKVLREILPVVDNLERAIEHAGLTEEAAVKPIVEGVQLVLRQLQTAFERLEVTPVEALGQPFDPNQHEAISQQESDQPPGTVVQVLQRGYRNKDRLLRPALVVVATAKAAPAE